MEIMQVVYWLEYSRDPALNLILLIKDPFDVFEQVKVKAKNIEKIVKLESKISSG